MQLNLRTDYALRVLIYLQSHDQEVVSVTQIARAFGISTNHLAKVGGELVQHGWVAAKRGRGGGLSLLPATRSLSVGDVVREMERSFALVECLGPNNTCPLSPRCLLKKALQEASQAFLRVLDDLPLSDLSPDPEAIQRLLRGP